MRTDFQNAPLMTFATLAILLVVSGCGDPSAAGTVKVSGTVTLDGQPVDAASVAFMAKGGTRLATSQTDKSGKFTLRAAEGTNAVTVAKGGENILPVAGGDMLMPSEVEYKKLPVPKPGIPAKYADPKTSGLVIDAVDGMDVDLALSTK